MVGQYCKWKSAISKRILSFIAKTATVHDESAVWLRLLLNKTIGFI